MSQFTIFCFYWQTLQVGINQPAKIYWKTWLELVMLENLQACFFKKLAGVCAIHKTIFTNSKEKASKAEIGLVGMPSPAP